MLFIRLTGLPDPLLKFPPAPCLLCIPALHGRGYGTITGACFLHQYRAPVEKLSLKGFSKNTSNACLTLRSACQLAVAVSVIYNCRECFASSSQGTLHSSFVVGYCGAGMRKSIIFLSKPKTRLFASRTILFQKLESKKACLFFFSVHANNAFIF